MNQQILNQAPAAPICPKFADYLEGKQTESELTSSMCNISQSTIKTHDLTDRI